MPKTIDVALEAKKQAFADAFLGAARFSVSEAARMAGYKGTPAVLSAAGSRLLRDPKVGQMIKARAEDAGVYPVEVLALLARHMRGDMTQFVTESGEVELDLQRARNGRRLGLLRKFKQKKRQYTEGTGKAARDVTELQVEVELYDAQAAADKLCKVMGLYGKDDGTAEDNPDDLQALIDELLRQGVRKEKWDPGLVRLYESRTRQITSQVVEDGPARKRGGG